MIDIDPKWLKKKTELEEGITSVGGLMHRMETQTKTAKEMNESELLAWILRVLRSVEPYDCEEILWGTKGECYPVRFSVNCNDLFWWGTADCEEITPENIDIFEQSYKDARDLSVFGSMYANSLFCARVRKMRPQGASYPKEEEFWPLFDACGPERVLGIGNPYKPGRKK